MNFKKFMAAFSATAVAVSAMAVSASAATWEGSVDVGNWASYVTLTTDDVAEFANGDVITINFTQNDAGAQVQVQSGDWAAVPFAEADSWGGNDLAEGATSISYTVTEDIAEQLNGFTNEWNQILQIKGKYITITSIDVVPAEDEEEEEGPAYAAFPATEKTVVEGWSDVYIFDATALEAKDVVVVMEPTVGGEKPCYFKVAGNSVEGAWTGVDEGAPENLTKLAYDAENGTITIPADVVTSMKEIYIQGEFMTVYAVAYADDTDTLDAAKAERTYDITYDEFPATEKTVVEAWSDVYTFDVATLDTTKDIVVVMEPTVGGEKPCYFKVAGNTAGEESAWVGVDEGAPENLTKIAYDAENGTITIPADLVAGMKDLYIQGEFMTVYAVVYADDAEAIEAAQAERTYDLTYDEFPADDKVLVESWSDIYTFDVATLDTTKDIVVVMEPLVGGAKTTYFKVAGNTAGEESAWVSVDEGALENLTKIIYDAEAGTITIPADLVAGMKDLWIQGEFVAIYGVNYADAEEALAAAQASREESIAAGETVLGEVAQEPEEPTEEPTDDDSNPETGVVVALGGVALAAAAVVATKKRK